MQLVSCIYAEHRGRVPRRNVSTGGRGDKYWKIKQNILGYIFDVIVYSCEYDSVVGPGPPVDNSDQVVY